MLVVSPLLAFDHALRSWVVLHRIGALDGVMWGVSAVGRGGMIWVLLALVLIALRRFGLSSLAAVLLALLLASLVTDQLLKPMVGRERPYVGTPDVRVIGGRPDDASFPSGHAANAFAGAYVLSAVAEEPAILWWGLAIVIAYSRVYLGVHYPLDVAVGGLIGIACGALAVAAMRRSPWGRSARGG
jgi:undecaprenyl-diphosphatase